MRPFLFMFATLRKSLALSYLSFRLTVRPHETNRLPPIWFSWNLMLKYVFKFCRENSSLIEIWQYLDEFSFEWEIYQIKFLEKIKTHILCSITFFPKNCAMYEIMWKKYGRATQITGDNTAHALCMLRKLQTHTRNMQHLCLLDRASSW